jgi:hypothetical protein
MIVNPISGEVVDKIVFVSLLVGNGYLWLLENWTTNLIFSATFTFDLQNLANVSYKKELQVELRSGQEQVIRFMMLDPGSPGATSMGAGDFPK